jgi:hypothetical protein
MFRIAVYSLLCALMLLFMGVQYNDPDGLMWIAIYAVPALWCAVSVWKPMAFRQRAVYWSLLASIAASLAGVIYFWPLTPRFWVKEVWYEVETAREGMGLMIVAMILGLVWWLAFRQRADLSATAAARVSDELPNGPEEHRSAPLQSR